MPRYYHYPRLNIPVDVGNFRIQSDGTIEEIWDELRKKYVRVTPEEWVRQNILRWLVKVGYPAELIAVEKGLFVNKIFKRFDILVFGKTGEPFLLVECKSPKVKIDEKTLNQAIIYNKTVRAPYMMITNGMEHFIFGFDEKGIRALKNLPPFE